MRKRTNNPKCIFFLGVFLSLVVSANSQTLETSKDWLKEQRKHELKRNISLETEYLKLTPKQDRYSNYKTLYEIGKEKYSIDYLNNSIKEELKYMSKAVPASTSDGASVVIGGLNLSDPKAWFTAAKLKKRKRKMQQITTYVYWIE